MVRRVWGTEEMPPGDGRPWRSHGGDSSPAGVPRHGATDGLDGVGKLKPEFYSYIEVVGVVCGWEEIWMRWSISYRLRAERTLWRVTSMGIAPDHARSLGTLSSSGLACNGFGSQNTVDTGCHFHTSSLGKLAFWTAISSPEAPNSLLLFSSFCSRCCPPSL